MSGEPVLPPLGLAPAQLAALAATAVPRSYPRHAVLVSEGDTSDSIFVILEGRVRVFVADDKGREATLNTLGPGEYFGELALDGRPRSASVMTTEPTRALVLPLASLETLFASHPDFAMHLVLKLIRRVRGLTDKVKSLSLQDVYGRLRDTLEELAVESEGVRVIEGRLTQSDLASRIGASREMVSRIFSELKAGGYVSLEPGRLVIRRRLPLHW